MFVELTFFNRGRVTITSYYHFDLVFLTYRFILDKFNRRLGNPFFINNFSIKTRSDG